MTLGELADGDFSMSGAGVNAALDYERAAVMRVAPGAAKGVF